MAAAGDRLASGADFAEYAAARRTDLVRVGVLLGSPPEHAALVADRALALARRQWPRLRDDGDLDGTVLDLLLEQRAADRSRWWEGADPVLPPDLSRTLDALTVRQRALLAWTALGHADAEADHDAALQPGLADRVLEVATGLVVPPPTAAEPVARSRRPLVLAGVAAAVLLLLATLVTVLRPGEEPVPEPPLDAVEVVDQANPAPVAWYADGTVHLQRTFATVEGVEALVEMGAGAVYLDTDGRVVRLDGDGDRLLLGRADPEVGLLGSEVFGRVAFVTESGRELLVVDVADAEVVARRGLAAEGEVRLVRMAGSLVIYTQDDQELGLYTEGDSSFGTTQPDGEGTLVDVVGGTELRQLDPETIQVSQALGEPLVLLGSGGEISPRQQFVLTRSGEGGTGVRVFAVGTGEDLVTGLTDQDVVLDARFTGGDLVTYLLADRQAVPDPSGAGRTSTGGPLEVRTCQVRTGRCTVDVVGGGAGDGTAVLAR